MVGEGRSLSKYPKEEEKENRKGSEEYQIHSLINDILK